MWVAKPVVNVWVPTEEVQSTNQDGPSDGQSDFDEAWEEFTNLTDGFVEDAMDADSEQALANKVLEANADENQEVLESPFHRIHAVGVGTERRYRRRATAPRQPTVSTVAEGGLSYER